MSGQTVLSVYRLFGILAISACFGPIGFVIGILIIAIIFIASAAVASSETDMQYDTNDDSRVHVSEYSKIKKINVICKKCNHEALQDERITYCVKCGSNLA